MAQNRITIFGCDIYKFYPHVIVSNLSIFCAKYTARGLLSESIASKLAKLVPSTVGINIISEGRLILGRSKYSFEWNVIFVTEHIWRSWKFIFVDYALTDDILFRICEYLKTARLGFDVSI